MVRWAIGTEIAKAHEPDSKSFFVAFCSQKEMLVLGVMLFGRMEGWGGEAWDWFDQGRGWMNLAWAFADGADH